MSDQPHTLPIDQLQPNPFQPRSKIKKEEIQDLVQSLKSYGVIEPLVVASTPAGYQIIAGERRWRAAKEAGLEEVPVIVKKTSPREMLELALVENVQRKDLNPIERAKGFQQLIQEFNFSLQELADKVGKSASYISNSQRLLSLPDRIKDGLIQEKISEGHARALAGLDDVHTMIDCYKQIVEEGASVRRAEQLVRQIKQKPQEKSAKEKVAQSAQKDERLLELEKKFKREFGGPADFALSRSQVQTRLTITLKGKPEQTEDDLNRILELLQQ
jgi:ParB family chromosome partitioning protein